jgi:hypothetical protein
MAEHATGRDGAAKVMPELQYNRWRRPARAPYDIEMQAEREWPVFIFACLVAFLLVLAAYATDHTGYVDELGLYNPSYMFAHYGNLTYPQREL